MTETQEQLKEHLGEPDEIHTDGSMEWSLRAQIAREISATLASENAPSRFIMFRKALSPTLEEMFAASAEQGVLLKTIIRKNPRLNAMYRAALEESDANLIACVDYLQEVGLSGPIDEATEGLKGGAKMKAIKRTIQDMLAGDTSGDFWVHLCKFIQILCTPKGDEAEDELVPEPAA